MKIWVDTTSGTWGAVDDDQGRLLIVDLEAVAEQDVLAGLKADEHDAMSLFAFLDGASDSEIVEFADKHGTLATGTVPDCSEPGPYCVEHGGKCD